MIQRGILIDASDTAKAMGILYPVAITRAVWTGYIDPYSDGNQNSERILGALQSCLWTLFMGLKHSRRRKSQFLFPILDTNGCGQTVKLKAVAGQGDNYETVITIMELQEV